MIERIRSFDEKLFTMLYSFGKRHNYIFSRITFFSKPIFIIIYSAFLVYTYFYSSKKLVPFIIIPFLSIIVSIFLRKIINRNRPCNVFNDSSIPIKKVGSCPSNHASSAFIIAYSCIYIFPLIGYFIFILAIISSVSRIFVGIHFPVDIFCGFVLACCFNIFFSFY